jgi:histidinol dehydrogenase
VILAACALCKVDEVFRMGGAQAIAALAYGTESVRAVDVIAGPGNVWVQEAKRQVVGQVGIDGIAGPSELVVVASAGADPELIALDLRAQAEHGPDSMLAVIATEQELLDAVVASAGEVQAILAADASAALRRAEEMAPEHLELVGADAEALAGQVRRAGCVFVGRDAGTAFGDYIAGSNHILPTNGAARFQSALSASTFRRRMARVSLGEGAAARLAPSGAALARAEGFPVHAESMERRA